ncbi:MAG: anthranilate synthase component I family protein [Bacteroidetes bacterium]|nr:anthranilate synthase component I family protein [Bacteroidota bacterium]
MNTNICTQTHQFNSDVHTPVELYLQLRHKFRKSCLMESNDYYDRQDSKSFIGVEPLIEITLVDQFLTIQKGDEIISSKIQSSEDISLLIKNTLNSFQFADDVGGLNGFFGRVGFEFAHLNEDLIQKTQSDLELPDLHLFIYKYILIIDHFNDQGTIVKNSLLPEPLTGTEINILLDKNPFAELPFEIVGQEKSNRNDEAIKNTIKKALEHVERGNVFQLVISNRYEQAYFGDDFKVYRALRRLNPSPYLFYFDFESYRLFGSSPEAQIKIDNGVAEIHPIAGTVKKTGNSIQDELLAQQLLADEKENAEHTMLVDLARNDLSRNCNNVRVEKYKQLQAFSHVQHLVSIVKGSLMEHTCSFETFTNTFPAGTLSGTPKPKALELIQQLENNTRDFYGGAIGLISANGNINMAIVIRSVLSKNGKLYYRAGAGVVIDSQPDAEVEEIHNKLGALRRAIKKAAESDVIQLDLI